MEKEIKKCWNCKHRTKGFKVGNLTHYHCMSPTYQKQHDSGEYVNAWETLRVFSDTCNEHESNKVKEIIN